MQKIIVIGCPGSGKSTFSRKLSLLTDIRLYHLDMIWHKEDKTNITQEEFDEKVDEILNESSWIIDGNYNRTIEKRIISCDTVFLFDLPTKSCIDGVEKRIGKKRDDMPWIEEEFDEEFKEYIINFSADRLPNIYNLLEIHKLNKQIIIFKSRKEADIFLENKFN